MILDLNWRKQKLEGVVSDFSWEIHEFMCWTNGEQEGQRLEKT